MKRYTLHFIAAAIVMAVIPARAQEIDAGEADDLEIEETG